MTNRKRRTTATPPSCAPSPSAAQLSEPTARVIAAYIRVSTPSQDYAYQRHAIEAAARASGTTIARWYADTATGASMQRPELARLRRALAGGEIEKVWVWRLDRLTRSGIVDTLSTVQEIRAAAALSSVADGFALGDGPAGELVLAVLAWAAQMERTKIRENQEAARARLRAQGRSWGRPPLAPHVRDAIDALASQGFTPREIARQAQVSTSTVHKQLARRGRPSQPNLAAACGSKAFG